MEPRIIARPAAHQKLLHALQTVARPHGAVSRLQGRATHHVMTTITIIMIKTLYKYQHFDRIAAPFTPEILCDFVDFFPYGYKTQFSQNNRKRLETSQAQTGSNGTCNYAHGALSYVV